MNENLNTYFFDFESLELYKKSLDYIDFVYEITQLFPKDEVYGLTSQFKRAANSISLNIGEGYGESIPLAFRRKYIDKKVYLNSRNRLAELSKISAGYRKYLISKKIINYKVSFC